ncbi:IS66 family insertion sequence element accessory protein TnpB [Blautia sp.]|uniref:IS66 family insertion sequence element accessory protein TnpB n=1 Tax=Blautia sp. TaxID=1955243 RepID=UPI003A477788
MMRRLMQDADRIFIACGATDFRKQIPGLVALVNIQFKLDPYQGNHVFIFCNKKKDSIKVLRYDSNGFILATKKLLDELKFRWPRTPEEVKEISFRQVEWLLQGLEIEQKKAHHRVKTNKENTCF